MAEMGSAELSEWVALLRVEPWGCYRQDLQAALCAWAALAPWSKQVKMTDLLLQFGDRKPGDVELDFDQLKAYMVGIGGTASG